MHRTPLLLILTFMCYTALNAAAVFLPFIPGPGTFFLWGLVLPSVSILAHWVALRKKRSSMAYWWIAALLATLFYTSLGFGTLWVISAMWASV